MGRKPKQPESRLLSASEGPAPYFIGPYAIRPHVLAPHYNDPQTAATFFNQIVNEVKSEHFNPNAEALNLIRETGYVSLWFFLNCVAAHSGPYEKLNDHLSLDMLNTRQSDEWEAPGALSAAFIPRNMYKSTVFDHGGITWDCLRNPNERAVIVNGIAEKADEFLVIISNNFSQNELMAYLYPEHCAFSSKKGQLSMKGLILPNRTRHYVEPTVKALGVGGKAEGGHYTIIMMDDLVGLDDLNASRASNMNMEQAKRWLGTNLDALKSDQSARVGVVATRYAVDDCYQRIYDSCKTIRGWTKGDIQPVLGGEWNIYFRQVEEDGIFLRPSVMNKEKLDKLMIDDPWAAMTQWYNSPFKAGLAEFAEANPGRAKLIFHEDEWWLVRIGDNDSDKLGRAVKLADCDVAMTVDPAATEKGVNAKTCRTSIGIWATDENDNKYRIWSRVGYFSQHQTIDHMFEGHRIFKGYIHRTIVEVNAYQKVLKEYLDREQIERDCYIGAIGVQAQGDKVARIRVALGTYLMKNRLWLVDEAGSEFRAELRVFPMSASKMDVLDESEKGITFTHQPESLKSREERHYREEIRELALTGTSAFGY